MTNGSLSGLKQGFESQINLSTKIYIRGLWPFQSSTITLARFEDRFLPAFGSTAEVFKGDGQNFNINLQFFNSSVDISHPRIKFTVNNQDVRGSHDIVPGGYFKVTKALKESIEDGASSGGFRSHTADYVEKNSFISTFSSLGHLQPWQNWSNPLNRNLVCPSNREIPFDSYFGKSTNTEHTSFSREGAEWLKRELAGTPQAPSFPLEPNLLSGDNIFCENQPKTYQFTDVCKIPGKATFSVTGNLVINSFTDYSVTVQSLNGGGAATITADFGNGVTVEKKVFSGKPSFAFIYNYFDPQPVKSTLCVESDLPNQTLADQGITNIVFTRGVNNTLITGFGSCRRTTSPWCVKATVTNACGSTTLEYDCFLNRTSSTSNLYKIYPNPSKDIVNIDLRDENNQPVKGAVVSGELFDIMGMSRAKVAINNNKATFSVQGLNKGIYVLKIYINDQVEGHQLAVE